MRGELKTNKVAGKVSEGSISWNELTPLMDGPSLVRKCGR